MARTDTISTNFTGGELTPRARGRVDVSKYGNCLDICENFIVRVQGGVYRRSGTRYVQAVKDSTQFTRLFEFNFSITQSYIIEAGNLYFRFYRNQAQLVNPSPTPVEVVSPFLTAELPQIQYTQSGDIVFFAHNAHPTQQLQRTADVTWAISDVPFTDGPYLDDNKTSTTINPSGTTGAITLTASSAIFLTTDVGRMVRLQNGSTWGWGKITAFTSSTVVSFLVVAALGATGAVTTWKLGAFSQTTGYPGVITFHEQRLALANTPNQPQTVFMSVSADFFNYAPTDNTGVVADNNSIVYTIASSQVNSILWMESGTTLLIGTAGGEWQVTAPSVASPLSPTNIKITPQTNYGSTANVRSVRVGYSVLFLQRSACKAREMVYEFQIDNFVANDISIYGEHTLRQGGGVVDCAYQAEPDGVVWYPRKDGQLVGMTYLKEQSVIGFHRHLIGGDYNGLGYGVVESVAVIPAPDLGQDQVWMVVKRTINGQTVRYIEFMEETFDPANPTDFSTAYFLDGMLSYNGAPTNEVTGLTHLIGETVDVIADGSKRNAAVVDGSGNVAVSGNPASNITAGLPFVSLGKTLPFESSGTFGTAQAKVKRVAKMAMRLNNTLGIETSGDGTNFTTMSFRDTSDPMDAPPPLFTGDKIFYPDMAYDTPGVMWFRQSDPYPMEVLAIMLEAEIYAS